MTGSTGISASIRAPSGCRFPSGCGSSMASAASGRPTEIRLADFLRADDEAMLDTARHEYAHAAAALLTGQRHGHDALWKSLCVRIGCRPERLAEQAAAQAAKNAGCGYLVRCKTCGAESCYLRRGAVVRSIAQGRQDCRCRRCGGRTFTLERMRADGL